MLDKFRSSFFTIFFSLLLGFGSAGAVLLLNQRPTGTPIALLPPPPTVTPVPLRVHIMGAVNAPGVYQLPQSSIVQDAIDTAGGLLDSADTSTLNLAGLLADGQQLFVPELPPTLPPTPTLAPTPTAGPGTPTPEPATPTVVAVSNSPTTSDQQPATSDSLVNINTATLAQLDTLPRIGPAIAQRIIDYRTANGPFTTIEQIMNVKGIGPATFEQLKNLITVN